MANIIFKKFLLIGLLLFSTFLSSTHHHRDLQPHYDCPICIFQINNNAEDIEFLPVKIKEIEEPPFKIVKNYKIPLKINLPKANQRAPPV